MTVFKSKQTARKFLITVSESQDDMLNKLSRITRRSKAALMREALNQLLGMYREALMRESQNERR